MSDTPTLPPSDKLSSHMDFYCQENRATQLRMIQPPPSSAPRCVMHTRGSLWSEYAEGRVDNVFSSNSMIRSHVQIPQDISTHESDYQPRDVHTPAMTQKKEVLDERDFQPEQRARLPHLFANWDSTEVAEGSVQQAWCGQRAILPAFRTKPRQYMRRGRLTLHHITAFEQRARLPHFHANRYSSADTAEGSNQEGRPPISTQKSPQQHRRHS